MKYGVRQALLVEELGYYCREEMIYQVRAAGYEADCFLIVPSGYELSTGIHVCETAQHIDFPNNSAAGRVFRLVEEP